MKDVVPEDYNEDVHSPLKRKIKFTARDVDDSRFSKTRNLSNGMKNKSCSENN